MQQTLVDGISMWSRWQPDRGLYFNSYLVALADGAFVVDPLDDGDGTALAAARAAGAQAVVVTNRDHERAAAAFAASLGVPIVASVPDAPLLGAAVDRAVASGDDVFGWRVIVLDGFKTAGEMVLYHAGLETAISGDAFWGAPAGSLRFMPDEKLLDPQRATRSARTLRALALRHLLVGDGAPVFNAAATVFGAMLDRRGDPGIHRVNLDELEFVTGDEPAPFGGASAEIGGVLGARKLGYRAVRIADGEVFCPYHWHSGDEELFIVLEGRPALRTPAGETTLRPGDFIAFANGPGGAHTIANRGAEPAVVAMIAAIDAGDVCFYPDSGKHAIEATGLIAADGPGLDYYHGE